MITITTQVWTEAEQDSGQNHTVFSSLGDGKPENQVEELVLNRLHDAIEVVCELTHGFVTGKGNKKAYDDAVMFVTLMANMVLTIYDVKPDDFCIAVLERYAEIDQLTEQLFDVKSEEQLKAAIIKAVGLAKRIADNISE